MKKYTITSFFGIHRFLSNFYTATVRFDGRFYPTAEHAYQAAKTTDEELRLNFQRVDIQPAGAKRMGRLLKLRPDWESIKLQVMEDIVRDKFTRNTHLAHALMQTGSAELIEGNSWGDTFWGACQDGNTLKGKNHLGKILMKVREELITGTAVPRR